MTDTEAVTWSLVAPGILQIDLHRAPANALGLPIVDGLAAALDAADAAEDVRVVVVASDIAGFFAAGADIKLMATIDIAGFTEYGDKLRSALGRLAAPGRLSVAAVEGLALGGGLELAMACTMRVAGANAKFGLPEVKIGLIPGAGGTQRLPRLVGRGRALDIMLTARQVEAPEAAEIGLVDRLVEPGSALEAALALAAELLGASALAQAAVVRTVDAAFDLSLEDGIALERYEVGDQFEHGDGREGLTAFIEKRAPEFGTR
jgi:enoyl-CoA hydratase/carnithine racemase